jgi:uncharacterized protein DUF4143
VDHWTNRRWIIGRNVRTITQRVIRELADLERLADIPRLLSLCAVRTGTELNTASIASELGVPARTLSAHLAHLATAFLIRLIPAWSTNLSAKVVRRTKLVITDVGLAAHLQEWRPLPFRVSAQYAPEATPFSPKLATLPLNQAMGSFRIAGRLATTPTWSDTSSLDPTIKISPDIGVASGLEFLLAARCSPPASRASAAAAAQPASSAPAADPTCECLAMDALTSDEHHSRVTTGSSAGWSFHRSTGNRSAPLEASLSLFPKCSNAGLTPVAERRRRWRPIRRLQ